MTAQFFDEVRAEFIGLLARPMGLIDLGAEPTRPRAAAVLAPVAAQPVAPAAVPVLAPAAPAVPAAAGGAPASFRSLSARFPGRCKRCGGPIVVGQVIRYGKVNGRGLTYHELADCAVQAAAAVAQPVAVATPAAPLAPLAPVATSPLAFAMAAAQKPRRTRQAAPRATIAPAAVVSAPPADDWF